MGEVALDVARGAAAAGGGEADIGGHACGEEALKGEMMRVRRMLRVQV